MSKTADDNHISETLRCRQKQGPACAECRKRKLRCDGQQPRCGTCADLGVTCEQTSFSTPRGPKKGHMRALQSRIANLEARLLDQENSAPQATFGESSRIGRRMSCEMPGMQNMQMLASPMLDDGTLAFIPDIDRDMDVNMNIALGMNSTMNVLPSVDQITPTLQYDIVLDVPEIVQADLNQLFFERVHSFIPILQRRRYSGWSNQPFRTEAQMGLQYALWTLASAFSAQSEHLRLQLRTAAISILTKLETEDIDPHAINLEHAQARVILLFHDLLRCDFDLIWRDAAITFRLLQYMHLYDIDAPPQVKKRTKDVQVEDSIYLEEHRRTFWVAYTVDCFINIRGGCPSTFYESAIAMRLPVPEESFQAGRLPRQNLLSEAMNSSSGYGLCPFSESIIVATICNRAMSHGQQVSAESTYVPVQSQIWERHFWIETMLLMWFPTIDLDYIKYAVDSDGLLVFDKLASRCVVLYLYQILESRAWIKPEDKDAVMLIKKRVTTAAREVALISNSLNCSSLFKIHPLTPILLGFCTDFLKDRHADFDLQMSDLQQMTRLLAGMSSINRLASHAFGIASVRPSPPAPI